VWGVDHTPVFFPVQTKEYPFTGFKGSLVHKKQNFSDEPKSDVLNPLSVVRRPESLALMLRRKELRIWGLAGMPKSPNDLGGRLPNAPALRHSVVTPFVVKAPRRGRSVTFLKEVGCEEVRT